MPIAVTPFIRYTLSKSHDDLTIRQMFVLMECAGGPQTVKGLAERGKLNKPAISRAATKLQTAGWLARKTDDLDRRSVVLSLTKAGAKFASVFE
jgi:DNA-binding MarR family transcriptional regulator